MAFPSAHPPRMAASATATAAPQGHVRGRPPIATFSANPDAKGMALNGSARSVTEGFVKEVAHTFPGPMGTCNHSSQQEWDRPRWLCPRDHV